MVPQKLLEVLRNNANYYHLPNTLLIFRNEPEVDVFGGTANDFRQIGSYKGRVINNSIVEELSGGGITTNNEWLFIMPDDADVMAEDRIYIFDDENSNRYFEVVGTDRGVSEGIFLSAKALERTN